jgi:sporulation protein YlmC with PRC-barrel domain
MKRLALAVALAAALPAIVAAAPPVVGQTTLGIAIAEMKEVVLGWSAKNDMLGKPVYNEKGEKIGSVDDVIITPDKAVSYAIIGTGSFVMLTKHDVAIPITQIKVEGDKLVLPGATKEALTALPEFQYAKR